MPGADFVWLVVLTHLEKYESQLEMIIPIMENKSHVPNHQPVTILAPFKGMLQISALGIVFFLDRGM